jgi:hypothetical protein
MNNVVQTSGWKVVEGTGRFTGMRGRGQMKVRWERPGASKGQETFEGEVFFP